jgi:hypothetical protein
MTSHDPRPTEPATARVYAVPVVREVPIRPLAYAPSDSREPRQPLASTADSHAW